jgi:hypothetical protein
VPALKSKEGLMITMEPLKITWSRSAVLDTQKTWAWSNMGNMAWKNMGKIWWIFPLQWGNHGKIDRKIPIAMEV